MNIQIHLYHHIAKPFFFRMDPETIHDMMIAAGRFFGSNPITRGITSLFFNYKHTSLNTVVDGIAYQNPIGLAAGFDKNAYLVSLMPCVGFGFEEVGSITAQSCDGNKKPRVFRLPKDDAIIINYGLCNQGVQAIAHRLQNTKKNASFPIGINIAKTNDKSICGDFSVDDYYQSYVAVKHLGNYITINISCPNSGDGRSFEDPVFLEKLLKRIHAHSTTKPIYLKISPDIEKKNLDSIISLAERYGIAGFIVSNLTHDRSSLHTKDKQLLNHPGGISGRPVAKKANTLLRYMYKKTQGKKTLIAVGGIFSAEDAYERIKNGASLVQLITGMIYRGPGLIRTINKDLVKLLKKDGFSSIQDAVGVAVR